MITRRQILAAAATAPAWLAAANPLRGATPPGADRSSSPHDQTAPRGADASSRTAMMPLKNMGGTPTAFSVRARANRGSFDMVEHCHRLGLGAAQTRLPANDADTVKKFRQRVESYGMRVVLSTPLPKESGDLAAYDTAVAAAKEAGAVMLHAAMTQRRYEEFDTFDAFRKHFEQCQKSITLAEPVLRKHRIKLAIENHKGWRAAEHAAWLGRVGSEWVGACFDFGNNLALCEDPMDTLRLLAPYTIYCHMKDMGVDAADEGFLLSEVIFGTGIVDLAAIIKTLQEKDPTMIFGLEMITRDPLNIPVFTDRYWATYDDVTSTLPGRDLAKVLTIVKKNKPKQPLPRTTGLAPDAQVALEDELNQRCIDYCRQRLPLS